MDVTDLLKEALGLMVIGMGIVFAFLLLLVGVMRVMSAAAMHFAPEPQPVTADSAQASGDIADAELVAVISAAIARFRAGRNRH